MDHAHQSTAVHSGAGVALAPPINRLPTDILELILLEALPDAPLIGMHPTFRILVRVCRTWRSFVMGTPKLWASFTFSLTVASYDGYAFGSPKPDLLAHFLAHAGTCGLTLQTSLGFDGTNDVRSLELFLGVSNQWLDLRLDFISALVQLNPLRNHLSRLKSLQLVERSAPRPLILSYPRSTVDAFENASCLRYVVLEGLRFPETIPIPIGQLGILTINNIGAWPRIPNLLNNPCIPRITFNGVGNSIRFDSSVWRSLRSLFLATEPHCAPLLSKFTCPRLYNLSIHRRGKYSLSSVSSSCALWLYSTKLGPRPD
ncbi:hypothetical protein C8R44DRAFT_225446 [Mycena epipterygia]|nr:hypothetical protein C8R44DRAFT_225446 [Mycena epipterygia]